MLERSVLMVALLVAACSGESTGSAAARYADGDEASAQADNRVPCALGGAQTLAARCTIELAWQDGASHLIIRHPDGGFRRFVVSPDGSVTEADGAARAVVSRNGEMIEVAVAQDRYRLSPRQVSHAR